MRGFSFFLGTDAAGHTNCVSVFALNGRRVFRLRSSGELRSAERGDSPRPAAGQEGRHQGFYPLNSHFLLGGSGADCRYVTASKKEYGRGFFLPYLSQPVRSAGYCSATQAVYSAQSAAQGELPEGQERVPWGIAVPRNSLVWSLRMAPAN